jgi:uncharacterized protein (DUF1330 family)
MDAADDTAALVARLIEMHGEGGVCPTAEDWFKIMALGENGPVHILNLLKFKDEVETGEGPISGAAAYGKYSAGVSGAFSRAGGQRLYFGRVGHMFGLGVGDDWDAAILTRYPSAAALAQMWLSPEFVAAHEHRADGLERSQVMVFGG